MGKEFGAVTWVYWDINMCPVPDGCDPCLVRPCIKNYLKKNGYFGPLNVTAIGKLTDINRDILRGIYSSGINLTNVPHGSSDIPSLIDLTGGTIPHPANFMLISDKQACPGFSQFLQHMSYNPLQPFPYDSLETFFMKDSGALKAETDESASWYCLVCACGPPAQGFENFITHLSSAEHQELMLPSNILPPLPPVDPAMVHVYDAVMHYNLKWRGVPPPFNHVLGWSAVKSKDDTLVYWDISLCPVPPNCDASLVGPLIKHFLKKKGISRPPTIIAIGVLTNITIDILRKVYSSGIALHIVPYGSSDIPRLIFECCHWSQPPSNIMVISSDNFFTLYSDMLNATCNFMLFESLQRLFLKESVALEEDECSETGESVFWLCSVCNFRNFPCHGIDSFASHLSGKYHQQKLSDLLFPGHCFHEPQSEPLKENLEAVTSVFWDIKVCPVPPGFDPCRVGPCIRRFLENKGYSGPLTITAIGTLVDVNDDILRGVYSSGVGLDCVPYGFSIALDRLICEFINTKPPPANIMVISDAKVFASDDVMGLQSIGYNLIRPFPCDFRIAFLADSGAVEEDSCSETSKSAFLCCSVCCMILSGFKDFITHVRGKPHQRKLSEWGCSYLRPENTPDLRKVRIVSA